MNGRPTCNDFVPLSNHTGIMGTGPYLFFFPLRRIKRAMLKNRSHCESIPSVDR